MTRRHRGSALAIALAVSVASRAALADPMPGEDSGSAADAEPGPTPWATLGLLRIRDMTPFGLTRLDMRPAHAVAAAPGTFAFEFNLTYQNTWALSENVEDYLEARGLEEAPLTQTDVDNILALPGEAYLVDGEFGLADLTLHYRMSSHWGLYATIPYLVFNGGGLDSTIQSFHDAAGFGAAGRDFVQRNRFRTIADIERTQLVVNEAPDNDFGDPVLGARYSLKAQPDNWNLVVEAAAKIPRGDAELFVSTGEPDYGLQLSWQRFFTRNALYLSLSEVYYSSPDTNLTPDRWLPTIVGGWETRVSEHVNVMVQLYASKSVVRETELDELRADKLQATLGVQWLYRGAVLRFAITENLANFNNTPDLGVNLSFGRVFFGSP